MTKPTSNKDLYVPHTIIADGVKKWLKELENRGYITNSEEIYNNSEIMGLLSVNIFESETDKYQVRNFTQNNFIMCPFQLGNVTIQNERELQVYQQSLNQLLQISENSK